MSTLLDQHGEPMQAPAPARKPRGAKAIDSGWFATQMSKSRGQLFAFPQDTRQHLTPWSNREIRDKARVISYNFGLGKSLENLSRVIGSLKPQARTTDGDWNEEAEERFNEIAGSPLIFDAAGRYTFNTWQPLATLRRFIDGDFFSILTETTTGHARVAGREAHQVSGGDGTEGWYDGVKTDGNGFPLRYRFVSRDGKETTMDPANVFHHCQRTTLGMTRGPSVLAHCINSFHDILELQKDMMHASKTAAMSGLTRKAETPHGLTPQTMGVGSPVYSDPFDSPDVDEAPADEVTVPSTKFEDYISGGLVSSVPLDLLHDDRPHPNIMAFMDELKRQAAVGLGVPHQLLFFMDDPGGAWSRILLESLAKFILDQHVNHLMPFCQRFWTYSIAKEMKEGRLRYPRGDGKFWKVRWTPPRSMTADLGRMGRLTIELRKALLTTYAAHYEELGLDYEEELRQCAYELQLIGKLEVEYELPPGSLQSALAQPNQPAPGQEVAEKVAAMSEKLDELMKRAA